MNSSLSAYRCAILLAFASTITACGGGGASADRTPDGVAPPPVVTAPALRFKPEILSVTTEAGLSPAVSVSATAQRPNELAGTVYALVVDKSGILLPDARLLAAGGADYSAVLHLSPNLTPGTYTGKFSVMLCRDSGCGSQFPGSPVDLPYDIRVTAPKDVALGATPDRSLAATMHLGAPAPSVSVAVSARGLNWTAASNVPWARLNTTSGWSDGRFSVQFDSTGMTAGDYQGEIKLAASDGRSVLMPVSLQLLASAFRTTTEGYEFNSINGAPIFLQEIKFDLDSNANAAWTAKSDSSWMWANPDAGVTPGTTWLHVSPSAAGLASGSHTGNLTLSSPYAGDRKLSVKLNLTKPTLKPTYPVTMIGQDHGRSFTATTQVLSLNTGINSWPWVIDGLPAWLTASSTNPRVNADGTKISLTADYARAPVGTTTLALTARAQVNGDTVTAPFSLMMLRDQQKILPSTVGIAMVSTPGWSRLSRTVTVSDNFKLDSGWSAASDKPWLSISRNGNSLTLQADPVTLPADATSYATVTLTPSSPDVTAPEKIRVGLWKGSSAPVPMTRLSAAYTDLVADPIRPLVYAHNRTGTIDAYNVYTGQKTASTTFDVVFDDLAISPDGSHLYARDISRGRIVAIELATMTRSGDWAMMFTSAPFALTNFLAIRPNGVELLLTPGGVFRTSDGKRMIDGGRWVGLISASENGRRLFGQTKGLSLSSLERITADYSEIAGGFAEAYTDLQDRRYYESNGTDIATRADGERFYAATATADGCIAFDSEINQLNTLPGMSGLVHMPGNVELDTLGRIYCGSSQTYQALPDTWIYDASGAPLRSLRIATTGQVLTRQLAVSGDAMMMVALTNAPEIVFIAVGP